jgi:RecA/RadA recombinase
MYELMGWEGKSTICGHATAECQKAGGTVLYIDGENVDKKYFQELWILKIVASHHLVERKDLT